MFVLINVISRFPTNAYLIMNSSNRNYISLKHGSHSCHFLNSQNCLPRTRGKTCNCEHQHNSPPKHNGDPSSECIVHLKSTVKSYIADFQDHALLDIMLSTYIHFSIFILKVQAMECVMPQA